MTLRSFAMATLLIFSTGTASAQPAAPAPRDTVTAIAGEIRELYFSAERGDAIADALEAEAASGRYDALTDPRDLETALTARLEPYDQHFSVGRPAPAPPAAAAAAAGSAKR